MAEEYTALKEAGMPLDSMKLVLNEDLSALNEDATHVLTLNERLTRYALYVSSLERSNKELGAQVETVMAQLGGATVELKSSKDSFARERSELIGQVAAAEAKFADMEVQVEGAHTQAAQLQAASARSDEEKEKAQLQRRNTEKAAADLRGILEENNIAVPKNLTAQGMEAASRREAFAAAHGAAAERMLDAAGANADSARIALRVGALQELGVDPPVDEEVMDELLASSLGFEQQRALQAATQRIAPEFLVSHGISPADAVDAVALDRTIASSLSAREQKELAAGQGAREVQLLAGHGVMPPVDQKALASLLAASLTPAELAALSSSNRDIRKAKLEQTGIVVPDTATDAEIGQLLKDNLQPHEVAALESSIVAGQVQALAERGVAAPIDQAKMKALLAQNASAEERKQLDDAACLDKMSALLRKNVSLDGVIDEDKMDNLLREELSPEEYAGVQGAILHEKMSALAATGKQVPVDEVKLQKMLQENLSASDLAALNAAEQDASYNSARAAMRLEKLLEKGVPLSDELVLGCQRGDPASMAELDKLTRENLDPEELAQLLAMEEDVMAAMFDEAGGEFSGGSGGGGGAGSAAAASASGRPSASSRASRLDEGMIDKDQAAMQEHSRLLDLQEKMQSDYLTRLSESSAALRRTLQGDLDKEQRARREAQARNLALLEAVESQRARNAELMAKLAEHEARELERLRQLEGMQTSRELELDAFKLQAERAVEDAAEAKAAREQLERAIGQYEKILDAIGVQRSIEKSASASLKTSRMPAPAAGPGGGLAAVGGAAIPAGATVATSVPPGASVAPNGQILNADGMPYLDANGGPVFIAPGAQPKGSALAMAGGGGGGFGGGAGLAAAGIPAGATVATSVPPGSSVAPNGQVLNTDGTPALDANGAPMFIAPGAQPNGNALAMVGGGGGGFGGGGGPGSASALAASAMNAGGLGMAGGGIVVQPAMPAHLLQLEKFVLLTDEGAVAVRARFNGTVGYLKRQVATQLHISPRLALTITASSSTVPLRDDAIIGPYAEGKDKERLLLSAAPRPLSDFFPGLPSLPAFRQIRVRPLVHGVPHNFSVIVSGVSEKTTVRDVQLALSNHASLLPMVSGKAPQALALYFSPVFITPDVLLGRKSKQVLVDTQSLLACQLIDDDIVYLSCD